MNRSEPVIADEYTYMAVYEPAEEGGFVVRFPSLPGLVTEGETMEEARAMAADALRCFVEGHLEDGLPIPPSDATTREPIREPVTLTLRRA